MSSIWQHLHNKDEVCFFEVVDWAALNLYYHTSFEFYVYRKRNRGTPHKDGKGKSSKEKWSRQSIEVNLEAKISKRGIRSVIPRLDKHGG